MRKLVAALWLVALVACGNEEGEAGRKPAASPPSGPVTVYSGRSEQLVGPLFRRLEEATGIKVEARYGDTAELAAQILEEGDRSPADVFFAQDAGALGAVATAGRFTSLDRALTGKVPSRFGSRRREWVGVSGRARTVVFNPERVDNSQLPESVLAFADDKWKGRLGWAPTNGSFQAFVTALRKLKGEQAARDWLTALKANGAKSYPRNPAIVEAVAAGEIDAGFVNHYYVLQISKEKPGLKAANHFAAKGDPGALVNVAGVGILRTSDPRDAARRFVEFLLSKGSQEYFAAQTFEYPLVEGVDAEPNLPSLDTLQPPDVDLSDLDDLQGTLDLLKQTGVL